MTQYPLASDEAFLALAKQVLLCLQLGKGLGWPSISPEHGRELLREIIYWRKKAELVKSEDDSS